jgi:hypothetical protein
MSGSVFACNATNLMHYSSPVYSIITPLHVSGLLVAHLQDMDGHPGPPTIDLERTTRTNCHIYTLLPPEDGLLTSPKRVEV